MQKIVIWGDKVIYDPENVIEAIHCGYENVLLVPHLLIGLLPFPFLEDGGLFSENC